MCPDRRRRDFLRATSLVLAAPALALKAFARVRVDADPFTLGVASGSPLPDGVVLWMRLAPDPLRGGGLPPLALDVGWELAADESCRTIVRAGSRAPNRIKPIACTSRSAASNPTGGIGIATCAATP